jgi:hypothetical protein
MSDLVKRVTEVTLILSELAQKYGCSASDLAKIWAMLPVADEGGMTYLEAASQCILEVSSLIDQTAGELSYEQRTAKKYYLMADLLKLKADQLLALVEA